MNKQQLIQQVSGQTGIKRDKVRIVVESLLQIASGTLSENEPLTLKGFGSFSPWQQVERPGRNPKTGVSVPIPSRTSVKFKPGSGLLAELNALKLPDAEPG